MKDRLDEAIGYIEEAKQRWDELIKAKDEEILELKRRLEEHED